MKNGFTLIEFLIYIGIVTILLVATLSFAWMIIKDEIKQEAYSEINNTGNFAMEKISYFTKRADTIGASSVYNTNPGKLILNYVSNPTVTFDTYQKSIMYGDTPLTITKIRMQIGTDPAVDLSSDNVNVTNFKITNLSNALATTTQIELTLTSVNPNNDQTYAAQKTWTTSITLR